VKAMFTPKALRDPNIPISGVTHHWRV
jgi:hypothetical protein